MRSQNLLLRWGQSRAQCPAGGASRCFQQESSCKDAQSLGQALQPPSRDWNSNFVCASTASRRPIVSKLLLQTAWVPQHSALTAEQYHCLTCLPTFEAGLRATPSPSAATPTTAAPCPRRLGTVFCPVPCKVYAFDQSLRRSLGPLGFNKGHCKPQVFHARPGTVQSKASVSAVPCRGAQLQQCPLQPGIQCIAARCAGQH